MIKVQLTDATIALGGDFAGALALVKSVKGRSYDAPSKTWSLPIALANFQPAGRPFDILSSTKPHRSGEHVTSYGTRYSRNEWSATKAIHNIQIPSEIIAQAQAGQDAAEQALVATLRSFGLDTAGIAKVRGINEKFQGDFSEAEQFGHIKFSSAQRREDVEKAFDAYYDAWMKAERIVADFRSDAERAIIEDHGIY